MRYSRSDLFEFLADKQIFMDNKINRVSSKPERAQVVTDLTYPAEAGLPWAKSSIEQARKGAGRYRFNLPRGGGVTLGKIEYRASPKGSRSLPI